MVEMYEKKREIEAKQKLEDGNRRKEGVLKRKQENKKKIPSSKANLKDIS